MAAMEPRSVRYDLALLAMLTERARQYRPPVSRQWLMNHLLWQAVDPALDWYQAIRDVTLGNATPIEVLQRAAEALSRANGAGMVANLELGELQRRLSERAEDGGA